MKQKRVWAAIKKDKARLRKDTAAKSFSVKLGIVERMRTRDATLRQATPVASRTAKPKR